MKNESQTRESQIQRLKDKIKIRLTILDQGFKDLELELKNLRDARLNGEDFSESEHREVSVAVEHDAESQ